VTGRSEELALLGGRPVFVQTAEKVEDDRWRQMTEEEAQLAYDMTLRNEISGGTPTVRQVEEDFAKFCRTKHCMSVCNGSAALYCAYFGVGLGPGDEIICPTYTWICTAGPALLLGARLSLAGGLVGRTVTVVGADGLLVTGVVEKVIVDNGEPYLVVGDEFVPVDQVLEVM